MLVMPFLPVNGESEIYDNTLRLHVLANSDSEEDQALKLKVRDAVIKEAEKLADGCMDINDAKIVYGQSLSLFKETAERVIAENGYDYAVDVVLSEEYYPERQYEEFRLPAGNYNSLRVKIGEAVGKNWWCVLFPPLCLSSSVATEDALINAGMDEDNAKTVTCDGTEYKIRFRVLDWWSSTKEKLSRIF